MRNYLVMAGLMAVLGLTSAVARAADDAALWSQNDPVSTVTVDHDAWDLLLSRYVVESDDGINRFRYGAVTSDDKALLKSYIAALEAVDVPSLTRDAQFAYWANLYNAVTVDLIVDRYPVKSIRKITRFPVSVLGPWDINLITVKGQELTLNNIEHDILRTHWNDPRVHYAVNCASIGCPNLITTAFRPETLDATLDANARAYINHPRGARIEDGKLYVSSIYKWFREDFGDSEAGVIAHLKTYAEGDLAAGLETVSTIAKHGYDWDLNEASSAIN